MFTDDLAARIDDRLAELAVEIERLTTARAHLTNRATEPTAAARPRSSGRRGRPTGRRGHTNQLVLNALDPNEARTAGDVDKATGVGRAVAGATLSRLVKHGKATKAHRGYLRAA
jgi:hypothetical protein